MTTETVPTVDLAALRRRTLGLLATGQILGGLGTGAALSVGALAANALAGEAWSGMAATMSTLGAALLAIPLARLADRRGRRISLTSAALIAAAGVALCVLGMVLGAVLILFVGLAGAGAATAAALQSRFAATDLAAPATRGPRPVAGGVVDHRRCGDRAQPGRAGRDRRAGARTAAVLGRVRASRSRPSCWRRWRTRCSCGPTR